jgi:hypothetical protein
MIKGALIEIQRGELPASRRFLELRWGWSGTKVSDFLKILGDLGMITVKSVRGQTVINLVNYGVYNDGKNGENSTKKQQKSQQKTTLNPVSYGVYEDSGDEKKPQKSQLKASKKPVENQNKEREERNKLSNPPNPPEGGVGSSLSLSLAEDKKNIHRLSRELFENHFRDVFGDEYYWTAKDAGNMSSLLGKIKFRREKKGMPNETGDMLDALKSLLLSITDGWLFENFSVSNINSKFNEILSKAKE